nr:MAG TPA: hypothetical protein [Caudoviricetes sp.]
MEMNIKEKLLFIWVIFLSIITSIFGFISMGITIIGVTCYYYYNCIHTFIRNKL